MDVVPGVQYPTNEKSQIGGYLEGHQSAVDEDQKIRVGLLFYILSDVILAIFFIGSYIFLRGYDNNVRWMPPGVAQPPLTDGFNIMIICVASAVAFLIGDFFVTRSQGLFRLFTFVALVLVVIDVVYQIELMGRLPFTPQDGAFATSYIVLSGYHVYHLLLAVFLGVGIVVRGLRGIYDAKTVKELYAQETGAHGHAQEPPHNAALPVRITSYYFIWTAVYALCFWALVLIQPPTHP